MYRSLAGRCPVEQHTIDCEYLLFKRNLKKKSKRQLKKMLQYFKKNIFFFLLKTWKKGPQKLLKIGPKLLPFEALSKQTYLYISVHPSSTSSLHNSTIDRIGNKTDSMVSLLGCKDIDKMSMQFLGMSATPSSCDLMRQHRVVPFLVKILHSGGQMQSKEIKRRYL